MRLAMPSVLRVRNWPFYMWPPSETRPEIAGSNTTGVSAATFLVMQGLESAPSGRPWPEATCLGVVVTSESRIYTTSMPSEEKDSGSMLEKVIEFVTSSRLEQLFEGFVYFAR